MARRRHHRSLPIIYMVPRRGLEPPHSFEYSPLKTARLPIPPPRQGDYILIVLPTVAHYVRPPRQGGYILIVLPSVAHYVRPPRQGDYILIVLPSVAHCVRPPRQRWSCLNCFAIGGTLYVRSPLLCKCSTGGW